MLDQGTDPTLNPATEPPAEESNNRTFMIAVGILGGLVFITIICVLVYAFVIGPRLASQKPDELATVEAHNAEINNALTATAQASSWTLTAVSSGRSLRTVTLARKSPTCC